MGPWASGLPQSLTGNEMSRFKHCLILRSAAKRRVSKDGQQARCSFPPLETHRFAMLLRVRLYRNHCRCVLTSFVTYCFDCIHFESDSEEPRSARRLEGWATTEVYRT